MKGVIFDLDGVFYVEQQLIAGGIDCLRWLNEQQIPYRFVTNNTTMCRKDLTAKLRRLSLEVDEQEIMSANYAGVFCSINEDLNAVVWFLDLQRNKIIQQLFAKP